MERKGNERNGWSFLLLLIAHFAYKVFIKHRIFSGDYGLHILARRLRFFRDERATTMRYFKGPEYDIVGAMRAEQTERAAYHLAGGVAKP